MNASLTAGRHGSISRALLGLLTAGIALRLAVLMTAGPMNADAHFQVIQYIADRHALPVSNLLEQSYHPPLYYLLMAPLYAGWPGPGPIHVASFFISSLNLLLIYALIRQRALMTAPWAALIGFALACFLPEFVMFGSFISNDTLAMLVGTALFASALRYITTPSRASLILLAVLTGCALLTKGTFLLSGAALTLIVARCQRGRELLRTAGLFCLIWGSLGCFKYVDNLVRLGRPIVHNYDVPSAITTAQKGTWKGPQTLFDIDVLKLIRQPILQVHNTFSYPLLLYGTLWYPHIPDSTYRGNTSGYAWVGSCLYGLAIAPTLVFLAGLARAAASTIRWLMSRPLPDDRRQAILATAVVLLLANLTVVMAAGVKYDAWSCFQARLCFPSMMPALMLFDHGASLLRPRTFFMRAAQLICWLTVSFCGLYFVIEIGLYFHWILPGSVIQP